MTAKHTPGPWVVKRPKNPRDAIGLVSRQVGCMVRDICIVEDFRNKENEANARLIAAAPELLDALERIANYSSGGVIEDGTPRADRHDMIHIARAAIAKAKGEK